MNPLSVPWLQSPQRYKALSRRVTWTKKVKLWGLENDYLSPVEEQSSGWTSLVRGAREQLQELEEKLKG